MSSPSKRKHRKEVFHQGRLNEHLEVEGGECLGDSNS